ncbi:hypothetical protein CYY_002329 [Polysphondylium violaceum]|uniref:NF-X1-type zinc finger-containing protein n=1 Tax=Polysphondylium violaceum TaxID=133409 RepID=A0A8J4Q0D5_9MYCE|nr:hypothetical protein CYY_002329 [Polysphondylium violaceum]
MNERDSNGKRIREFVKSIGKEQNRSSSLNTSNSSSNLNNSSLSTRSTSSTSSNLNIISLTTLEIHDFQFKLIVDLFQLIKTSIPKKHRLKSNYQHEDGKKKKFFYGYEFIEWLMLSKNNRINRQEAVNLAQGICDLQIISTAKKLNSMKIRNSFDDLEKKFPINSLKFRDDSTCYDLLDEKLTLSKDFYLEHLKLQLSKYKTTPNINQTLLNLFPNSHVLKSSRLLNLDYDPQAKELLSLQSSKEPSLLEKSTSFQDLHNQFQNQCQQLAKSLPILNNQENHFLESVKSTPRQCLEHPLQQQQIENHEVFKSTDSFDLPQTPIELKNNVNDNPLAHRFEIARNDTVSESSLRNSQSSSDLHYSNSFSSVSDSIDSNSLTIPINIGENTNKQSISDPNVDGEGQFNNKDHTILNIEKSDNIGDHQHCDAEHFGQNHMTGYFGFDDIPTDDCNLVDCDFKSVELDMSKLKWANFIPVVIFLVVLSTSALAIQWNNIDKALNVPKLIHKIIASIAAGFWILAFIGICYSYLSDYKTFINGIKNGTQVTVATCIAMSLFQLSVLASQLAVPLAKVMFWMAAVFQFIAFSLVYINLYFRIRKRFMLGISPTYIFSGAVFILAATTAKTIGYTAIAWICLGVGTVYCVIAEIVLLISYKHFGLPTIPQIPAQTILIGYPSLFFAGICTIQGRISKMGYAGYTLIFVNLVIVICLWCLIVQKHRKQMVYRDFNLTWWGFCFPIVSFGTAVTFYYHFNTAVSTKYVIYIIVPLSNLVSQQTNTTNTTFTSTSSRPPIHSNNFSSLKSNQTISNNSNRSNNNNSSSNMVDVLSNTGDTAAVQINNNNGNNNNNNNTPTTTTTTTTTTTNTSTSNNHFSKKRNNNNNSNNSKKYQNGQHVDFDPQTDEVFVYTNSPNELSFSSSPTTTTTTTTNKHVEVDKNSENNSNNKNNTTTDRYKNNNNNNHNNNKGESLNWQQLLLENNSKLNANSPSFVPRQPLDNNQNSRRRQQPKQQQPQQPKQQQPQQQQQAKQPQQQQQQQPKQQQQQQSKQQPKQQQPKKETDEDILKNKFNKNRLKEKANNTTTTTSTTSTSKNNNSSKKKYIFDENDEKNSEYTPLAIQMISKIQGNTYECMVCFETIGKSTNIWCCSQCFTMFHLSCVKVWATKSNNSENKWKCPGCRFDHTEKPKVSTCFCGKVDEPAYNPYYLPHSCGEVCGKYRAKSNCPHSCTMLCHPGPCLSCSSLGDTKNCYCQKTTYRLLCGEEDKGKACQNQCEKPLTCGNHVCAATCHNGACSPCAITETQKCYCGKSITKKPCGSGSVDESQGDPRYFSCDDVCNRTLDCGNHKCTKPCHKGPCNPCELVPEKVLYCSCNQTKLKDLNVERTSCLDPIPICKKTCSKQLSCKQHSCPDKCHTGPCATCKVKVRAMCRCRKTVENRQCGVIQQNLLNSNSSAAFTCGHVCKTLRSCKRHECGIKCCSSASNPDDPAGNHVCTLVCNKPLKCGIHKCTQLCHQGKCYNCYVNSYSELSCTCGKTVILPPVPCGTKPPVCPHPCSIQRECGHSDKEISQHTCHTGPCPPCVFMVERMCSGGHELRKNVKCCVNEVSCGRVCGKMLSCLSHTCPRICHSGPCITSTPTTSAPIANKNHKHSKECNHDDDDEDSEHEHDEEDELDNLIGSLSCGLLCGIPLDSCEHNCQSACHPGEPCPIVPCKQKVKIYCQCKRRSVETLCTGKEEIRQLECDETCEKEERERVLKDAFYSDPANAALSNSTLNTTNNGANNFLPLSSTELDPFSEQFLDTLQLLNRASPRSIRKIESVFIDFINSNLLKQTIKYSDTIQYHIIIQLAKYYQLKYREKKIQNMIEFFKKSTSKNLPIKISDSNSNSGSNGLSFSVSGQSYASISLNQQIIIDTPQHYQATTLLFTSLGLSVKTEHITNLLQEFEGAYQILWIDENNCLVIFNDHSILSQAAEIKTMFSFQIYHDDDTLLEVATSGSTMSSLSSTSTSTGINSSTSSSSTPSTSSPYSLKKSTDNANEFYRVTQQMNKFAFLDAPPTGIPNATTTTTTTSTRSIFDSLSSSNSSETIDDWENLITKK